MASVVASATAPLLAAVVGTPTRLQSSVTSTPRSRSAW